MKCWQPNRPLRIAVAVGVWSVADCECIPLHSSGPRELPRMDESILQLYEHNNGFVHTAIDCIVWTQSHYTLPLCVRSLWPNHT